MDYVIRFFAGGLIVSLFAAATDVLRPKSFAGLLGARLRLPLRHFRSRSGVMAAVTSRSKRGR